MDEAVAVVGLARLEPDLRAGERLLTLLGELAVRDDNRSAEGVERLSADEPVLRRLEQRPQSGDRPSGGLRPLRARFAAEDVLCHGFFMVPCTVTSSPRRAPQATVQRTRPA